MALNLSLRERGEPRTRGVSPSVKETNSERKKKRDSEGREYLGLQTYGTCEESFTG